MAETGLHFLGAPSGGAGGGGIELPPDASDGFYTEAAFSGGARITPGPDDWYQGSETTAITHLDTDGYLVVDRSGLFWVELTASVKGVAASNLITFALQQDWDGGGATTTAVYTFPDIAAGDEVDVAHSYNMHRMLVGLQSGTKLSMTVQLGFGTPASSSNVAVTESVYAELDIYALLLAT